MKYKLITLIPAKGRYELFWMVCLDAYQKGLDVYVGTEDIRNAYIAKSFGFKVIETPTATLGAKMNFCMNYLRSIEWTHVMTIGSDNFVSDRWIQNFNKDVDVVVNKSIFFWCAFPVLKRPGKPFGAGRIISRRVLDRMVAIYPSYSNRGLDYDSMDRIKSAGFKFRIVDGAEVIDVKGFGESITPFAQMAVNEKPLDYEAISHILSRHIEAYLLNSLNKETFNESASMLI